MSTATSVTTVDGDKTVCTATNSHLEVLNAHLWYRVFTYLPLRELLRCSTVCRLWHRYLSKVRQDGRGCYGSLSVRWFSFADGSSLCKMLCQVPISSAASSKSQVREVDAARLLRWLLPRSLGFTHVDLLIDGLTDFWGQVAVARHYAELLGMLAGSLHSIKVCNRARGSHEHQLNALLLGSLAHCHRLRTLEFEGDVDLAAWPTPVTVEHMMVTLLCNRMRWGSAIPPDVVNSCQHLTLQQIAHKEGVEHLWSFLGQLQALSSLSMRFEDDQELLQRVNWKEGPKLPQLQKLTVFALPERAAPFLTMFANLRHLRISVLKSQGLPLEWTVLSRLERLALTEARLDPFPVEVLSCLTRLDYLMVTGRFTSVGSKLSSLTSLKELVLCYDALREWPSVVSTLTQLTRLALNTLFDASLGTGICYQHVVASLAPLQQLQTIGLPQVYYDHCDAAQNPDIGPAVHFGIVMKMVQMYLLHETKVRVEDTNINTSV